MYKNYLILSKKETSGPPVKWQWFRYAKELGTVYYRNSLHEAEPLKEICFYQSGKREILSPQKCYIRKPCISEEKDFASIDFSTFSTILFGYTNIVWGWGYFSRWHWVWRWSLKYIRYLCYIFISFILITWLNSIKIRN